MAHMMLRCGAHARMMHHVVEPPWAPGKATSANVRSRCAALDIKLYVLEKRTTGAARDGRFCCFEQRHVCK